MTCHEGDTTCTGKSLTAAYLFHWTKFYRISLSIWLFGYETHLTRLGEQVPERPLWQLHTKLNKLLQSPQLGSFSNPPTSPFQISNLQEADSLVSHRDARCGSRVESSGLSKAGQGSERSQNSWAYGRAWWVQRVQTVEPCPSCRSKTLEGRDLGKPKTKSSFGTTERQSPQPQWYSPLPEPHKGLLPFFAIARGATLLSLPPTTLSTTTLLLTAPG